uniref:Calponin-homology (CH) domain-containing protein n=1 Tax=Astyanax mexicanus TaxID=7994 RepID=A0A3B1J331_ASTMX
MSDILCRWLNLELGLSKVVEPHSFSKDFSSGYLLGEILSRYQLQDDFQHFTKNGTGNAKLNNFTRLEPSLLLLGVAFDLGVAKSVMRGQPGAATRLLYQLYVLLQKKKRSGLTGTAMETMQPTATTRLHRIENHIYNQVDAHYKHTHTHTHIHTHIYNQVHTHLQPGKTLSPVVQVTRAVSEDEMAQWNSDYVQKIRQRLEEDANAREQREKRRRRALIQQLHTHHTHEEMIREEQLIGRLMRQSQQEKRMAVQLMQIRQQKEVLRQNRILQQRQFEEQRLADLQQILDQEMVLEQTRLERQEELCKERELHACLAAERAQSKHQKHLNICRGILDQIVDLATKSAEYRLLTANVIPGKMLREWKELYFSGEPLYDGVKVEQEVEVEKQNILNQQDYSEYTNMTGEWAWPEEEGEIKAPPPNNDILGHVVARLRDIVNPPGPGDPPPLFPSFTLRACVLGKLCSGKTSCLTRISQGIYIYHTCSTYSHSSCYMIFVLLDTQRSLRAQYGAELEKVLKRGGAVSDELLINILIHAIRYLPAHLPSHLSYTFPVRWTDTPEGQSNMIHVTDTSLPVLCSLAPPAVCGVLGYTRFLQAGSGGSGLGSGRVSCERISGAAVEKALSGTDPDQADRKRRNKRPNLAKDRNAPKAPPPPSPALHLAVLLQVSDEQVVDRAVRRRRESTPFSPHCLKQRSCD